jgi:hypothetical protein
MAHTRTSTGRTEDGRKRAPKGHLRRHPDRISIELSSLAGLSLDKIASRFNVGRDAVARHMKSLDPDYKAALSAGVPLEELAEAAAKSGMGLIQHLDVMVSGLARARIEAAAAQNHSAHAMLSNALTKALMEKARITGDLKSVPTITNITNNVAVLMASPMMQRLQTMLMQRLAPYPEALTAVLDGLAELDGAQKGQGSPLAPVPPMIEGAAHAA